jgi:hypothetical protein
MLKTFLELLLAHAIFSSIELSRSLLGLVTDLATGLACLCSWRFWLVDIGGNGGSRPHYPTAVGLET